MARVVDVGVASLGSPLPIAVALVVLAALGLALRGRRGLALVLVGPPAAMVTTSIVLKPLIGRTHEGGLAFPSGHTTAFASTALTAGVLLFGWVVVPVAVRWIGGVVLAVAVVAVGLALVAGGFHYFTDTVGGAGVAIAVVIAAALLVDAVADARGRRAPDAAEVEHPDRARTRRLRTVAR